MRIGDVLRYSATKDPTPVSVDGLPNFWRVTTTPGEKRAQLEKGINPIAPLSGSNARVPAILMSSSPHKRGSEVTPWEDTFDPDVGRARYFGDSKVTKRSAPYTPGNAALLAAFSLQTSSVESDRAAAPPLLLFRRVTRGGVPKGFVEFQGVALIEAASLVTQVDFKSGLPFTNFVFDLAILDQSSEAEELDWAWISARRSSALTANEALLKAPAAWRRYVKSGVASLPVVRRSAATMRVSPAAAQLPAPGTPEQKALNDVFAFYDGRKHRFEAVAEMVAARVLGQPAGYGYHLGWLSQRTGDGGRDFVGRLDVGSGFAKAPLVVLGQAKCERSVTSGRDIARTVARLRRGWLGCYVTTSYFSQPVQREVIEDKYPLVLIHGLRVARELLALQLESGTPSLVAVLTQIDATYEERLADRNPEDVLYA